MTKRCSKCNVEKEVNNQNFRTHGRKENDYRNVCKVCERNYQHKNPSKNYKGIENPRKWSFEEIEFLKQHYSSMKSSDISEKYLTKRTVSQINDYAIKMLHLHKDIVIKEKPVVTKKKKPKWTQQEIDIIVNNYCTMKTDDIISMFNINKKRHEIVAFANKMGLKKDSDFRKQIRIETAMNNLKNIPSQKGENSPVWVERHSINCDYCGKELKLTQYKIDFTKMHFCDTKCAGKWRSENCVGEANNNFGKTWSDESKRKQAENSARTIANFHNMNKRTVPEIICAEILEQHNLKYDEQFLIKYYVVDYKLDNGLIIEVQGNFFHCNPRMNLQNSRKDFIIRKDKSKHTYIKKYYNCETLYLWEEDLKKNKELCEMLILEYVKNNGILNNYHSFNYYIDSDSNLKLIDSLYCVGY